VNAHKNNVGVLRLLFSACVIIGHAPEMLDGDRLRDPFHAVFHTLSLGEVSVDAFFLLSGYLITLSMDRAVSLGDYLKRRILRIWPAFVVAYLLSVFLFGSMVGAKVWVHAPETVGRLLVLQQPPQYPGQLPGLPYPLLNGSMWTIAYEFRCYLLVAAFGVAGLLKRKRLILSLTAAAFVASILATFQGVYDTLEAVGGHRALVLLAVGELPKSLRLTTVFLIGMCFYLYRSTIFARLNGWVALVCAGLGAALLYRDPHFAEAAFMTFGAAVLFWLGFEAPLGPFQKINDKWDVSYGVYLYGWPIANVIRWSNPGISPSLLATTTLLLALGCGAASWWGIERWAKDWARSPARRPRSHDEAPSPVG
jgi:peptidoglycan/LPS O-acetylase OafA/YrhL